MATLADLLASNSLNLGGLPLTGGNFLGLLRAWLGSRMQPGTTAPAPSTPTPTMATPATPGTAGGPIQGLTEPMSFAEFQKQNPINGGYAQAMRVGGAPQSVAEQQSMYQQYLQNPQGYLSPLQTPIQNARVNPAAVNNIPGGDFNVPEYLPNWYPQPTAGYPQLNAGPQMAPMQNFLNPGQGQGWRGHGYGYGYGYRPQMQPMMPQYPQYNQQAPQTPQSPVAPFQTAVPGQQNTVGTVIPSPNARFVVTNSPKPYLNGAQVFGVTAK
jgi:hypothetical protein